MAINLNDNLIVQAPKATDERYGPYASEAEALAAIEPIVRYQGLTAGVYIAGQLTEYWFRDGILDTDFVEKTAAGPATGVVGDIGFACSDEVTNLTTGLKFTFRVPYSMTISGVKISTNTAPTGSDLIVDVQLEGTTIFSVNPVIAAGEEVGGYDATLATTYLPVNAEVTVLINQVGSINAGTGLKIWLLGTKTACDLPPYFCNTHVNSGCVADFGFAWKYCSSISTFPTVDTSSGTNFSYAWKDCTSMTSFSSGLNLSAGTNFFNAWANCTSLTSFPLLDTSSGNIFAFAWENCASLTSFPLINTSSGTNFSGAWGNCTGLTSFPLLDVSSGINFQNAWDFCTNLTSFPLLDVSSGINFQNAWLSCTSLTSFPLLNVSQGTNFYNAWQNCTSLVSFPANMFDSCLATDFPEAWRNCALDETSVDNILVSLDTAGQSNGTVNIDGGTSAAPSLAGWYAVASLQAKGWTVSVNGTPPAAFPPVSCNTNVQTYGVTIFESAWENCTSLTSFPLLNVSSGTNFAFAWDSCNSLTSFPLLNTSLGTNFDYAWADCNSLTSFPLLNVGNGTNFNAAWYSCTSLTSFPLLDVSSGTSFEDAWYYCTSLTSFPPLNFSSGINFNFAWYYCTSLVSFPANMFDSCLATDFIFAWRNCALDQTSVDNILVSLDTAGQSNGTLGINGGTSAAPSATGLAAKASLIIKGWTVTTN